MNGYKDVLQKLSADIWDFAELKFEEKKSSNEMAALLEKEGFQVNRKAAGMETAFTAVYGHGRPVIGLLAEFDALSGLSQEADTAYPLKREGTECGHGCGHHLLGTAVAGAALAVRDYLKKTGKEGTVILAGCPAEEGGSGKAYMARAGVFDDLDVALTWHPGGGNAVITGSMQANTQAYFRFTGVSAHAAGSPHLGRSALDAVELMDIGANYMREHMEPTDRLHYAILDTGGTSPNVVQSHAEVLYLIRSVNTEKVKCLYDRVCKIAEGAALMTETQVQVIFDKACSNIVANSALEEVLYQCMLEADIPEYTKEDYDYAKRFKDTITENDIASDLSVVFLNGANKRNVIATFKEKVMADFVTDYKHLELAIPGSSDVGDVSHVVPTAQFVGACFVPGTPAHSWQMVAQGKSGIAVKGMLYAADVLARAAIKMIEQPELAKRAKEVFMEETEGKAYKCPIPASVMPNMNALKK